MVIGAPDAVFLRIFKPHNLGDLLKINSQNITKNHPIVVILSPDAAFLLIFKRHTLGDLFKMNSQNNSQKIIPPW